MNRSASLRAHKLTASQAVLLKELWPGLDHYELGAELYRLIFEQSPPIMALFPSVVAGGGPVDDNDDFIKQVAFLIDFFTEAILICDDQGAMCAFAQEAGRKQVTETGMAAETRWGNQIRPEYWYTFRSSMKTAMTKHLLRDGLVSAGERCTAVQAWCTLTSIIINEMRQAFQIALMQQHTIKVEESVDEADDDAAAATNGASPSAGSPSKGSLAVPDRAEIDWSSTMADGRSSATGGEASIEQLLKEKPRSASVRCKQRVLKMWDKTFRHSTRKLDRQRTSDQ